MVQGVEALAGKPDNLRSILGAHVRGRDPTPKSSPLTITHVLIHIHTIHTQINKI